MRLLLWVLLAYIGYRIIRSLTAPPRGASQARREGDTMQRDPICGIHVAEEDAVVLEADGRRLFFCSRTCLERFRQTPENK